VCVATGNFEPRFSTDLGDKLRLHELCGVAHTFLLAILVDWESWV